VSTCLAIGSRNERRKLPYASRIHVQDDLRHEQIRLLHPPRIVERVSSGATRAKGRLRARMPVRAWRVRARRGDGIADMRARISLVVSAVLALTHAYAEQWLARLEAELDG
jgi:hypothetical protein